MKPYLGGKFANSSSLYREGVETKKALEDSRKTTASILQCQKGEVFFTSGGTESNNIAILGTYFHHKNVLKSERIHFVTTSIEHSSVLEVFRHLEALGAEVTYVVPEENGIVKAKKIEEALKKETVLVSVMYANNEIGTIQPIREIGKTLKAREVLFHVDACQAALYLSLRVNDLGADFLTLDSSKFYGPKGVGMLFKKHGVQISPIMFGGGQEESVRPGTENIAGIVGFAEALKIAAAKNEKESARLKKERERIFVSLLREVPNLIVNGDRELRLPNNVNVCLPGFDAEYAVLRLDVLGAAVSSVTSCKTLSEDSSSYVVEAIQKNTDCSRSSLRITLGRYTTSRDVSRLIAKILTIMKK